MAQLIIYTLGNMEKYDKREKRVYTNLKIEAAAEGVFNALDDKLKNKYSVDKIKYIIKRTDKDKNGIITCDEAVNDKDNIFGLKNCEDNDMLDAIQISVNKELDVSDVKGLKLGIDIDDDVWTVVAKTLVVKYTTKDGLKDMFSNPAAVKYYSEKIGINPETNRHLAELFKAKNFTLEDIKNIGFTEDVLNDILSSYEN